MLVKILHMVKGHDADGASPFLWISRPQTNLGRKLCFSFNLSCSLTLLQNAHINLLKSLFGMNARSPLSTSKATILQVARLPKVN